MTILQTFKITRPSWSRWPPGGHFRAHHLDRIVTSRGQCKHQRSGWLGGRRLPPGDVPGSLHKALPGMTKATNSAPRASHSSDTLIGLPISAPSTGRAPMTSALPPLLAARHRVSITSLHGGPLDEAMVQNGNVPDGIGPISTAKFHHQRALASTLAAAAAVHATAVASLRVAVSQGVGRLPSGAEQSPSCTAPIRTQAIVLGRRTTMKWSRA